MPVDVASLEGRPRNRSKGLDLLVEKAFAIPERHGVPVGENSDIPGSQDLRRQRGSVTGLPGAGIVMPWRPKASGWVCRRPRP